SVAGLISLGLEVTKGLMDYYEAYKFRESNIAHTTKKLSALLTVLDFLQEQSAERKFRADEQELLNKVEELVQNCKEIILELREETAKFKGRSPSGLGVAVKTTGRRLAYPFRQSTLQKLDEDIDELCATLGLALQILQQNSVIDMHDGIEEMKELLGLVKASQISGRIISWLKAPDATIDYNETSKKKHPGTGLWFVKGPHFTAWLSRSNSFLWLNGFAGCGKSVLCSTAIQHTFRYQRSNPCIGIAFFFFTFNTKSKQNTSGMLRALVLQLSAQLSNDHELLSQLYDTCANGFPSDFALLDILHQLIRAFHHVYILLDALDESPRDKHRKDVLQSLTDIREWSEPGLHLLVTSRDEIDIRDEFQPTKSEDLSLRNSDVGRDISVFVFSHLRNTRRLQKWKNFHNRIEQTLTDRAGGVFRWVECQFTSLENCPRSEAHLEDLLASLPRSLDETYERMLLNIDEGSAEYARRALTFLCCAKRPLTVAEVIEGMAVDLEDCPRLNTKRRLHDQDDIHQVCPGFIEVDVHPDGQKPSTVRIAHFSVQKYLVSERIRQQRVAMFHVETEKANAEIASLCLAYLLEPGLYVGDHAKYPLTGYAAKYWHRHYDDNYKTIHLPELAKRLFREKNGAYRNWIKRAGIREFPCGIEIEDNESALYQASLLGLEAVVSDLISSNPTLLANNPNGILGESLSAAARASSEAVVRLLLENGVDVNSQSERSETPLAHAAGAGSEAVVRMLLKKGADVNPGGMWHSPLTAAAERGNEAVVRLLLEKGADEGILGGSLSLPLTAAARGGNEAVIRLLLDNGADVNPRGMFYTPLIAAIEEGNEAVICLLIENGANV
ncbi:hypothetical protein EDB80DRAFT_811411, partial [Ilyonectria destructans]